MERFYIRAADCDRIDAQILRAHQVEAMGLAQHACYVYMGEFESIQQARRQHVRELAEDAADRAAEQAFCPGWSVHYVCY